MVTRTAFRPDMIGSVGAGHDGGDYTAVLYFTSEAEAREGESKTPPPEMKDQMEAMQALEVGEPTFLNLKEPCLHSPVNGHESPWRLPKGKIAGMADVHTAHTAELDTATFAAARRLLYEVFDDMTDHDWEHALGGVHALAWEQGELVGHASLVQRRLLHRGRALRTGYVEGVGVRADRRRRGYAAAMMDALSRWRAARTTWLRWAPPTRPRTSTRLVAGSSG